MNADKGNITILIGKTQYDEKMNDFVQKGCENGTFTICTETHIEKRLNAKLIKVINESTEPIQTVEHHKRELNTHKIALAQNKISLTQYTLRKRNLEPNIKGIHNKTKHLKIIITKKN